MNGSGGAGASAGYRYQHLVTVETLLELFETNPTGTWLLGVDLRGQDSADYVVLPHEGAPPTVAVQVKSSMLNSSTRLTRPQVKGILLALSQEHPNAERYEIRTNRVLTDPATVLAGTLGAHDAVMQDQSDIPAEIRYRASLRQDLGETIGSVLARLHARISRYRAGIGAEIAENIVELVISRFRDLVDECATSPTNQYLTASRVAQILRLPGQTLAQTTGGRTFGRLLGFPEADLLPRIEVDAFLDDVFPTAAVHGGAPALTAIVGPSGIGKSSAVVSWVRRHADRYYAVIWLRAGSAEVVDAQVPSLLADLEIGRAHV